MNLKFQESALHELELLASYDRHSLLIEGPNGCGKSYLAKQYVNMLDIHDFASVQPTVQSIREALEASYDITTPIVFCIENLDNGVPAASYTLLKFLEEPTSKTYIIVTCRNRFNVPDTILSRSTSITMSNPLDSDILDYAEIRDIVKYNQLNKLPVWGAVKSLTDVETLFRMTQEELNYMTTIESALTSKDNVSSIVWKLNHMDNNTELDIDFVLNYIIATTKSDRIRLYTINCVKALATSRVGLHAVLAKYVLDCKYSE